MSRLVAPGGKSDGRLVAARPAPVPVSIFLNHDVVADEFTRLRDRLKDLPPDGKVNVKFDGGLVRKGTARANGPDRIEVSGYRSVRKFLIGPRHDEEVIIDYQLKDREVMKTISRFEDRGTPLTVYGEKSYPQHYRIPNVLIGGITVSLPS